MEIYWYLSVRGLFCDGRHVSVPEQGSAAGPVVFKKRRHQSGKKTPKYGRDQLYRGRTTDMKSKKVLKL